MIHKISILNQLLPIFALVSVSWLIDKVKYEWGKKLGWNIKLYCAVSFSKSHLYKFLETRIICQYLNHTSDRLSILKLSFEAQTKTVQFYLQVSVTE